MKLVSIIITNYNKGPYVKEAIDSAIAQTYANKEIIIIDDGSTDDSRLIIGNYESFDNVSVVLQPNHGVIYTRNEAIKKAKGDYILQLDADDKIDPNFLDWTVPILDTKENVGIVFCETEFFGEKSGAWDRGPYSLRSQLTANLIVVSALFRRSDYFLTNGYRNEFKKGLEDWDFWLSVIGLGREVVEINKVGFYYRILNSGRNASFSNEIERELKLNLFKLHKDLYLSNGLDSTNLLWEIRGLEEEIKRLNILVRSKDYRIGNSLLRPIRFIKKIKK